VAQDSQNIESLYDFVYLDRERLAYLSAQIFDDGTLAGVKREEKIQEDTATEISAGLKPIFAVAGKEGAANYRSIERHFDAGWTLPLNVLHRLDELGHIKKSLSDADFGDLVLMSGSMNLIDLSIMKDLWEPLGALERMSSSSSAKTTTKKRILEQEKFLLKHLTSIMKGLPHSIQIRLFNGENQAWASLRREYLIVNPEDFPLKHGPSIQGNWHCLAILDGKPTSENESFNIPVGHSEVEQAMWDFSLQLRLLFGRREHDYGLTPIAIFRTTSNS